MRTHIRHHRHKKYIQNGSYLRSADLVPGYKRKGLKECAEENILPKAASDRQDESQLRYKGQNTDQGARRGREGQVDVVKPERKVVAMILASDVVKICLEQKLVPIAKTQLVSQSVSQAVIQRAKRGATKHGSMHTSNVELGAYK